MKQFIINKDFWEVFPKASVAMVVATGVNNKITNQMQYQQLLDQASEHAREYLTVENFSDNEIIQKWRQAYQLFKTKKGARSSIEALLKRAFNRNPLSTINPLVDLYNCVSLEFGVPCGGEDINKIQGNMYLTNAIGNEHFITLGSEISEPPYPQEIIYKDDVGAICRCWNWRESTRTMLTEETSAVVFILEEVSGDSRNIIAAASKLVDLLKQHLNAEAHYEVLDINHPVGKIID